VKKRKNKIFNLEVTVGKKLMELKRKK